MKYMILLLASISLVYAQTYYIWEGFDDGNADGWIEWPNYSLANYEVTDSLTYHMHYTGAEAAWALAYWSAEMPSPDYVMLMDFVAYQPTTHVGLCGRLDIDAGTGYVAYAHYGLDRVVVGIYNPGWTTLGLSAFDFVHGQHYQMKFQVESDSLMAKAWVMGAAEPDWQIAVANSALSGPGYVALEAGHHPSGSFSAEIDNVLVGESIPDALNQRTWAGIKASFKL